MIAKYPFRAMGSRILAVLDGVSSEAENYLEQVPGWFEAWEQILSRFRKDSELGVLNQHNCAPIPVSETLWELFQIADWAYQYSDGLVTPTILSALESVGYTHSFDSMTDGIWMPLVTSLPPLFSSVELLPEERAVRLPTGMQLDFGGIAKGWAAQQAMLRLEVYGPTLVDAGGDIAVSGSRSDGNPWLVGVEDPFHDGESLEVLQLGRCGVASSGRDRRRWQQAGSWQHHIIDPRTGYPAITDVFRVTVIAPNVLEAETAAKTVLLLGSQAGLDWLEAHEDLAGILVLEDGQRRYSHRIHEYIWSSDDAK